MKTLTMNAPPLTLTAVTAADLMSPNLVSLRADAGVREAIALFTDRGFGAAPVIDNAGRPIGVLSRTDVLLHEREQPMRPSALDAADWNVFLPGAERDGFGLEIVDPTPVRDMMTPMVFTVGLDTPVEQVVEQMLALQVHHLFVVDDQQTLVGVISPLDVVRNLRKPH
jgi:CBS domain-containing protein